MPSQYLNCDHCQATLGTEVVTGQRTPTFGDTPDLVAYAKSLGWVVDYALDLCPECAELCVINGEYEND